MRTNPPLTIEVAQLPGGSGPSEDRVFVTPNAVIVLDGATQVRKLERDGGWIAQQLGQRLADGLTRAPDAPLVDLLEESLIDLVEEYQLRPGESPSTTVNIVRCTEEAVDVLVLCDSPVALLTAGDQLEVVRDDRLRDVLQAIERPLGRRDMSDPAWQAAVDKLEAQRNVPGGFWAASASPQAARQAMVISRPIDRVAAALSMTDGVAVGIDEYRTPASWSDAFSLASNSGPGALLWAVQASELLDRDCTRWPRTKPHDDKALALLRLA